MSFSLRTSEIRELLQKDSNPIEVNNYNDEEEEWNRLRETGDNAYQFPKPRITTTSMNESISKRSTLEDDTEDCEDPNLEKMHCSICKTSEWAEEEMFLLPKNVIIRNKNKSLSCTIRRASRHDFKKIYCLCDEEVDTMFSGYNIYRLIESAFIQFVMEEDNGQIVAFIAVNDYPNPTFLPEVDWECWMESKYKLPQINTQNSVFMHFFVWNVLYEDFDFMEKLAEAIFLVEPFLEYLLFVLPPFLKLSYPYDQIFSAYKEKLAMDLNSSDGDLLEGNDFHYVNDDLVVACREEYGPKITLFNNNTITSTKICETIEEAAVKKKWIKKILGKSNRGKKIITAVSEDQHSIDAGLMVVKKKVDLEDLEKHYDTMPFYGFRSSTRKDTWFRIISSEQGLRCYEKWCFEESANLLLDPITQKAIKLGDALKVRSSQENNKSGDSDSESTTSEEDNFSLDESTAAYLDMFKVVGKNFKSETAFISCPDVHPLKKPAKMEFFGKSLAMEIEFYEPPVNQDIMLIVLYLKKLFMEIPRNYILVKVKDDSGLNPLLHYFQKVEKYDQKNLSKDVLYTVHRMAITGLLKVRKMYLADIESLMATCRHHPYKSFIQEDLLNIHLQKNLIAWVKNPTSSASFFTLEYKCFVFTVSDTLIGFTVVRQHHNIDYYKSNYDLEFFTKTSSHTVLSHGAVRHFFINPLFKAYTRFFLRAVMKSCGWTTLLAPSFSCYPEAKGCSVIQELEQWVQVRPRVLPEMSRVLDKRRFLPRLGRQYRGLNVMTYGLSSQHKAFFGCHLVVVGSGDVARSFLEYILLSRYTARYGFRHITLIANDGMQSVFPGKHSKATNMMVPWNGRHDRSYKDKCNIDFWVNIMFTDFIGIDREKRLVELESGDKLYFDYLFLFCGTQFPLMRSGAAQEREEYSKVTKEVKMPVLLNVFKVNNYYEANNALSNLENLPAAIKNSNGGQVIVYGNCVEAFSCVAALLETGIRGYSISLVLTAEGNRRSVSYIHSHEIMDSIKATLKKYGVNVYTECIFLKWLEGKIEGHPYVDIFHFKSGALTVVLKVIAIFCYDKKIVNRTTYIACKKSGLWYDNRLTIQTNFLTSDKRIYAGGSMTCYPKAYRTVAYNHEFYNSVEIGVEVAKRFLKGLLSNNSDREKDEESLLTGMIVFDQPLVICAEFPGGWHYVRITAPGNQVISMTDRSLEYLLLKTGDAFDENGQGLIQILLSKCGVIQEIVCFRRKKIPVKDLINLYAKHESLVNNLLCRFKGCLIKDLNEFLSEPWALFLYDDRFSIFYGHLHSIYSKNIKWLSNLEGSFTDFVTYALNLEQWKEITYEDKEFLEDLFCYHPELKRSIEKHMIRFLEQNEDLLVMLGWQEYKRKYNADFSGRRLLGDFREERGMEGMMPQPVSHIVPDIKQNRELDGKPLHGRPETFHLGADVRMPKRERRIPGWRVLNRTTAKGQCLHMDEEYRTEPNEIHEETDVEDVPSNLYDMQYEKCIEQKLNQFQKNTHFIYH